MFSGEIKRDLWLKNNKSETFILIKDDYYWYHLLRHVAMYILQTNNIF